MYTVEKDLVQLQGFPQFPGKTQNRLRLFTEFKSSLDYRAETPSQNKETPPPTYICMIYKCYV